MKSNLLTLFLFTSCSITTLAQPLLYPPTRKIEQVDTYHGTTVADPYRWLEDDRSPETAEWVKAQNKVTFNYLNKIPYRTQFKKRIEKLLDYVRYGTFFHRGEGEMGQWYYFYKNDGLQNQPVLYRQKGMNGKPEVVIDPNQLAAEGTTRLMSFDLSKDGRYAAYALSKAGSDWQEVFVMDLQTRKNLSDKLEWTKFPGVAWRDNGFYYSGYEKPEMGNELSAKSEYQKIAYHHIGTAQQQDPLVFIDKTHPLRYNHAQVTDDGRYLFIYISEGTDGTEVWYRDLQAKKPALKRLFAGFATNYTIIDHLAGQFLVYHNNGAPTYKVSIVNPGTGALKDFVPTKPEKLEAVTLAGGKLFAHYLKDVTTRVAQYELKTGRLENTLALPGLGTADGFSGEKRDKFVFYQFSSFTVPPTIYQYDLTTHKSTAFKSPSLPYDPTAYETKQVFCTSKDGTRVPMFLTYRKEIKLDGTNPTLLYGYGGYNVSLSPSYNGPMIAFLEQGGIYAVVNLRGGGEYGEAWHKQGMKEKKQNVFDDCIAAAAYLIAQNYTSSEKLALQGASNGGLLVGAVINQRPDLFRVAFPKVGVMDMLRFQKFTVGWGWVVEYGSSDKPEDFNYIYAYSPLHNIRAGISYPATLVTTADHDDRVVPAHSFKYAATLQTTYKGPNPVLIRIETNSGHGSVSTQKRIDENADVFSFLLWNMGVKSIQEIAER